MRGHLWHNNGVMMKSSTVVRVEFKGILKARCEVELEHQYRCTAALRKVDMADLVRDALRHYAPKLSKSRDAETATI